MKIDLMDSATIANGCIGQQMAVEKLAEQMRHPEKQGPNFDPPPSNEVLAKILEAQAWILIGIASIHAKQATNERARQIHGAPRIVIPRG